MAAPDASRAQGRSASAADISDLRGALDFLRGLPGQLLETDVPADPYLELAGIYRRIGAGTPVAPPTRIGPAVLFRRLSGFDMAAVVGVLASRERAALLLGTAPERLAFDLLAALERPVAPVVVAAGDAPCREVVVEPPFDLRALIPATTSTTRDAGAFLNLGLLRAQDPETGRSDVTIHRMCVLGPDTMTVCFSGPRHINDFRAKAERLGQPRPVSVSIGLDPAVLLAASF
jgi:gallate decarboxylase subunit C